MQAADRYGGVIEERGTAGQSGSEESGGFVSDLKGVPADVREATVSADEKLRETTREKRTLRAALDWPTIIIAFVAAFVLALIIHFVVSAPLVSVIAFILLFGIGWFVVARIRRAPLPVDEGRDDAERTAARERRAAERADA